MNPLDEAALRIQAFCEAERWRSCIIGGIAVHRWGRPEGHDLRTCSAEDLLVHKSFAARPHDWLDVEVVLDRQQERLDLDLVRRELKPLAELKPETDIMPELERRISRSQRPVRRFE